MKYCAGCNGAISDGNDVQRDGDDYHTECASKFDSEHGVPSVAASPLTEDVEARYCPPKDGPQIEVTRPLRGYLGVYPSALSDLRDIVESASSTEADIVTASIRLFDRTTKPPRKRMAEAMIEERGTARLAERHRLLLAAMEELRQPVDEMTRRIAAKAVAQDRELEDYESED